MSNGEQSFVVIGSISRDGTATIFESFLSADLPHTDESADQSYTLAFLDSGASTLAESPFQVSFDAEDVPIPLTKTTFSVVRPFPKDTASVEIRREGTVLATLKRTATVPTVANVKVITSVNLEIDKQIEVEWLGADPGDNNLSYAVSYSIDQGKSFRPIESGIKENRLTLLAYGLGGSKSTLIKVTATNGFQTSEAISEPFVLPTASPVATILSSSQKAIFTPDQPIVLRGMAFDYQNGVLSGEALEWFLADQQKAQLIGTGNEPTIKPLPTGAHTIRLVATNREGEQGTDERLIQIQEMPLDE
jgi:hypothetical protein